MKNLINIISILLLSLNLIAQSKDQNYILSRTYQTMDRANFLDKIQYFDGLGRPVETVQKAQSSKDGTTWVDLVSIIEYDSVGRDYKHWLPVPATVKTGDYVSATNFKTLANVQYTSSEKSYTTTNYELSPLNRVTGKYGAGASWYAGKKNDSVLYQSNLANEVGCFFVNSNSQLERNANNYDANTLYKTQTMDEDGKITFEYKDKLGQVIMKQNILNTSDKVNTYYVYNDFGQLAYVLPPIAVDSLPTYGVIYDNNGVLIRYSYLYKYDERGNNVVKRLPGCDSICMVYDKTDRLVMSQDGNQRLKNKWIVTKYDQLGRVLYTGLLNNTSNRLQYKAILDNQVVTETYAGTPNFYNTGYTCTGTLVPLIPLTVNYYDNYKFRRMLSVDSVKLKDVILNGYDACYSSTQGLLTGTRTFLVYDTGSKLVSAFYYDDHGRVVQTRATNYLGGYDITYNHYDFTGRIISTRKEHNILNQSVIPEVYNNTYDNAGRLLITTYQLNNKTAIPLTSNKYDELGRLINIYRHNSTDTITYAYNIRNWITLIKSGGFNETLYYNTNLPAGATACYNGNIAANTWKYNTTSYTYPYVYDQMNRLTSAGGGSCNGNFEYFSYDKQGNIKTLQRFKGYTPIDFLTMTYEGNQVKSITDQKGSQNLYATKEYNNKANTTNEMSYDQNGNMIKDLDRDIVTIRYNILNLPDTIQFSTGNQIINRYAADGQKLGTEYFTRVTNLAIPLTPGSVIKQTYTLNTINQNGIAYIDNKEYSTLNGNAALTALKRVYNAEGYAENSTSTNPIYNYYRKDHLGNIREVNTYGSSGPFNQRTQYYPSGLPWAYNSDDNPGFQSRKYNGKEFVEMHGLDTYDYGARGYYPAMGRFTTVDPLAEKYYSISPYAYCAGNPVNRFDPDGMDWYTSTDGKTTYWQEGNKKVDGYTNSETYTQHVDDQTSITYTQNDATSVTFTGIDKSEYVSQTGKTGCKVASDKMLANDGVNSNGERINVVNSDANGVATTPTKSADKGIKAVDNALENGHPVEVGVDYKPKQVNNLKPNGDGMTDHFVVVSSKTETLNNGQVTSATYNFFDPRNKAYGTSSLNILTRQNNMLKGTYNGEKKYTVTTVRTSSR